MQPGGAARAKMRVGNRVVLDIKQEVIIGGDFEAINLAGKAVLLTAIIYLTL